MTDGELAPGWIARRSDLHGRVAFVTGGGRGIGRTIALALADAGADVAVVARTEAQVTATAGEIASRGVRAVPLVADVARPEELTNAIAECRRSLGDVQILVSNAGKLLFRPLIPLPGYDPGLPGFSSATTDGEWDGILDVHLGSAFHALREIGPSMLHAGWGRVITVSSASLARSSRFTTAYETAKGALVSLTRSLAKEWARYGVTVNAIAPGHFPTEMTAVMHEDPRGREWMLNRIPMRRAGRLEELGPLAVFLASDASSYVTGQVIFVDGGESL